jgi:hypothetical protein
VREIHHAEDPNVDGKILKWILGELDGRRELDFSDLEQGEGVCSCECGNEPSGFIRHRNFSTK